ncbi:MAG: phosphonate ABC transporter, permease protein PhnE [candidate division NC10 bacterium]|nr:phosphonate ABC transporter, permease protein PhnE [candidate division NC10 bacterium]
MTRNDRTHDPTHLKRSRLPPSLWAIGLFVLLLWSYRGVEGDLAGLFTGEAGGEIIVYFGRLFPPDLSAPLLAEAVSGAWETLAISLLGTAFAVLLAFPLALLASHTLTYAGPLFEMAGKGRKALGFGMYASARALLNLLRTIPELVWALLFVFVAGLGPFPGVLALAVHTGGVLGKLFGEVFENVERRPLEALQGTGASRLQILLYGILPQALPQLISYTLYRWEVNIRAAAILGFVGAGGLGQRIHIAINLFLDHQLLTLLLILYLLVVLVDALSAYLRRKAL